MLVTDQISGYGCSPIHEKHDDHAEEGCKEWKPWTVIPKCRTPVRGLCDARVEDGEVDEGKRGHKEVGKDTWDLNIQLN